MMGGLVPVPVIAILIVPKGGLLIGSLVPKAEILIGLTQAQENNKNGGKTCSFFAC